MHVLEAYDLAASLHDSQTDKAGRPYIEHLTRVMLRVQAAGGDTIQQIAALLHDCIEDDLASAEDLSRVAGVPHEAVELVMVLSRPKRQSYEDYLVTVKANPRALLIKLADLEDNSIQARLDMLPEQDSRRLRKKYANAYRFLTDSGEIAP